MSDSTLALTLGQVNQNFDHLYLVESLVTLFFLYLKGKLGFTRTNDRIFFFTFLYDSINNSLLGFLLFYPLECDHRYNEICPFINLLTPDVNIILKKESIHSSLNLK